ncbi:MAG: ketoacyl-ACP synthase III [Tannerella sp.]|jgi:3-oxoacyl-[acyl-carrier-protein] synthase-3|nr:ketoacyl-ACP synthase III [Tannerella sp.]
MNATISSIGIYHPEKEIRNSFFEEYLDTSDQWIRERTGIEKRFHASKNEYTSDLCIKAALSLAKNYNINLNNVDFIIVATSTPDQIFPGVASQVQNKLHISNAGCMDISAACAGFIYGIITAKGLIAAQTHRKILVIGADTLSKITDFSDRSSCILFGDGAGAVIVEAATENHIFKAITDTDGSHGQDLYLYNLSGYINEQAILTDNKLHQNGKSVFKWAVTNLIEKIKKLAYVNNLNLQDIDYLIPHSANIRILEAVCKSLNISMDKCVESIRNYGNTSAASIPIAWYNGVTSGRIRINDNLLLIGFGGGLTCAGIYIRNRIDTVE